MVLSKLNKTSPIELAEKLAPEIKTSDDEIANISVAQPGLLNIKFKPSFWSTFIKEILHTAERFGVNDTENKTNSFVEYVFIDNLIFFTKVYNN